MLSFPAVADDPEDWWNDSYCSPFDDKCNGRDKDKYFGDDKEAKEDRVKYTNPQRADEPDSIWGSRKKNRGSLGDIQRGQLETR